jgi:GNAT superfamily N-acetyltransferase
VPCRMLGEAELLAWCADPELELGESMVRGALAKGDSCVGAFIDGRLVGYVWLAFGPGAYNGEVRVLIDSQSRYTYKLFVRPGYRGQRIARRLHDRAADPRLGRERSVTVMLIDIDNHVSLRSAANSGFRPVGTVGFIALRGRFVGFRTLGARRAGVAMEGTRGPRVRMQVIAPQPR